MFCQNCGLQQESNKRFCSKCGFQFVPNSNVPKVSTNIPSNQITFNPSRAITNFQTASPGARLGAYFLEVLLAIITLGIGYIIWSLVVWSKGTTPGHQILKMYVIDSKSGQIATWGHMALREFVIKGIVISLGSFFTFGILWLVDSLMIFRQDRRTLHDLICSTNVVIS